MTRLLALLAGGLGLGALLRRRRRRSDVSPPPSFAPSADDLRAKLAAARDAEPTPTGADAPAAPAADDERPADDVDARRAEVHERARRALDDLDG